MKRNFTLPLGESDAVAAGEGPPQPLPRLTLPPLGEARDRQAGG
jgi:hypothetical protein